MQIIESLAEMSSTSTRERMAGRKVGFVPTMGFLHKGHLELMRHGRSQCDFLVASIFVNPTQFGPHEGYADYPRDLERDAELAQWAGVDCLFVPSAEAMYPAGFRSFVEVETLSKLLCGEARPGHFRGVATVMCKLFNIVQPDEAYFGEKDAQQLVIVRRLAADLGFPVKVVGFPTVREADGLAMSSRNAYLSADERHRATAIWRAMNLAADAIRNGVSPATACAGAAARELQGFSIDYFEARGALSLAPDKGAEPWRLLVAATLGKTRLIDNMGV